MIAQGLFKLAGTCASQSGNPFPGLFDGLCKDGTNTVELTSLSDIYKFIGNLIEIAIQVAGALAVIFIMVGGIYYVISIGDPARTKRAKDIIFQAVTGLIIVLGSYAFIMFVSSKF